MGKLIAKLNEVDETVSPSRRNICQLLARSVVILILIVAIVAIYLLRGGFSRFEITSYPVPPPAFTNWNDVLAHPHDISVTTFRTGIIHVDACLNLDPASPTCDHVPRDLGALVHWVHHPRFGDFLIDTGFDDSFAKYPPYGNYTEAMRLFNWVNGVTNRKAETTRAYSLEPLRTFARAYPNVRIIYGHEAEPL